MLQLHYFPQIILIQDIYFPGLIVGHSVPAYYATKHAVVAYTRCLAVSLYTHPDRPFRLSAFQVYKAYDTLFDMLDTTKSEDV